VRRRCFGRLDVTSTGGSGCVWAAGVSGGALCARAGLLPGKEAIDPTIAVAESSIIRRKVKQSRNWRRDKNISKVPNSVSRRCEATPPKGISGEFVNTEWLMEN
jgi:hypothetical protein